MPLPSADQPWPPKAELKAGEYVLSAADTAGLGSLPTLEMIELAEQALARADEQYAQAVALEAYNEPRHYLLEIVYEWPDQPRMTVTHDLGTVSKRAASEIAAAAFATRRLSVWSVAIVAGEERTP